MIWCGAGILILLAIAGFLVVRTQDLTEQVIALGFYGPLTALMFFFFQAPMSHSLKSQWARWLCR